MTRATAEETKGHEAQDTISVTIGRDAANQAGVVAVASRETLESLQRRHGPPNAVFVGLVFQSYEPGEGVAWGREVATTRILQAVPGFVQQVGSCWDALPAELRPRVVGYHPAMLAVLLDETAKLRDVNLRYDARALAEGTQRSTSEAEAREAIRAGRSLGEQAVRIAQRWAPPAFLRLHPLPAQLEGGAANPDVLANGLDAVASWLTGWRATWSVAEREGYEALQFAPGQADALHGAAARVRETQAVVAAFSDTSPITQRELDAQDGRVLHVVDLIQSAFRHAARSDVRVVAPDLGELTSAFERAATKRAEPKPAKPEDEGAAKGEAKPDAPTDAKPAPAPPTR